MILYALLLSFLFNFTVAESTEQNPPVSEQDVESAITSLFDAMRASDGEMIRSLVTKDASLHTVTVKEDGPELRETSFDDFVRSVSQSEPGSLDERLTSMQIHVDGDLATAWMEYQFYFEGKFSHCGVNTMNLIQKPNGWKIFSIADTRRTEGC